ncbi:MAG: hypothetical protein GY928_14425, partial [Colwellia sp.]|nr:hypothetical protein [Colwellia sp.]
QTPTNPDTGGANGTESETEELDAFEQILTDPRAKKSFLKFIKKHSRKKSKSRYTFSDSDSGTDSEDSHSSDSGSDSDTNMKKKVHYKSTKTTNKLLTSINDKSLMTEFTLKMPTNPLKYYVFAHKLRNWETDNLLIQSNRKWNAIAKKFNESFRNEWNTYKHDKWDEFIANLPQTTDKSKIIERKQFLSELDNTAELKRFIVRKLNLNPHIHEWMDLLSYVKIGFNEEPT